MMIIIRLNNGEKIQSKSKIQCRHKKADRRIDCQTNDEFCGECGLVFNEQQNYTGVKQ